MNPTGTLKRSITLLLLTLGLCGTVQLIWAQDAAVEVAQPKTETNKPEAPQTPTAEKITPAPASENNDSPFDYEASEEISQDLSVSFPVDI